MKYCINKHCNPDEANFCRICGTQFFVSQDVQKDWSENESEELEIASTFTPDLYPDIAFKPESVTTPDFSTSLPFVTIMLSFLFFAFSIASGGNGVAIFLTILFACGFLLSIIYSANLKSTYRENTDYIEDEEYINGTRRIAKDGKLGLIDDNNKVLLKSEYTGISIFDSSILLIKHADKYGLYDLKENSFILLPKYDRIRHFDNSNLLIESDGKKGVFNLKYSKIIVPTEYDDVQIFDEEHYTLVSNIKKGLYSKYFQKMIVPAEYDEIGQFENQMCRACRGMITDHYDILGNLKR